MGSTNGIQQTQEVIDATKVLVLAIVSKAKDGITLLEVLAAITENVGVIIRAVEGSEEIRGEITDLDPDEARQLAQAALDLPFDVWKALVA